LDLECKHVGFSHFGPVLTNWFDSDGSTAQKQTEQILAVTPILRGQKSNERNIIPHRRAESYTSTKSTEATRQKHPEADLIDFGQNENSVPLNPYAPKDLQVAQTQNNGQQQKDLEEILRSTSTEPKDGNQGSLIDFHDDMKKNLPVLDGENSKLKRHDTDTQSLDEFVDAEE